MFCKPERVQSTGTLSIHIPFTLPLVHALLTPEGSELGPLCDSDLEKEAPRK